MAKTVTPEKFASEMNKILNDYNLEVVKTTNKAVEMTAREDVRELKGASRIFKSDRRKHKYRRSWTFRKIKDELGSIVCVVYNTQYQLTHLLEKGHDIKRNGQTIGHADAKVHIKPVADRTGKRLEDYFKSGIKKI